MNGYVTQLIAEDHIAELRAQAARHRLRTQAAGAATVRPRRPRGTLSWPARLRLDAESARRAEPLPSVSRTRGTTVRLKAAADC